MRLFLSYNFDHEPFVLAVSRHLSAQPEIEAYCYAEDRRAGGWEERLAEKIHTANSFVLFLGETLGETQCIEARIARRRMKSGQRLLVQMADETDIGADFYTVDREAVFVDSGHAAAVDVDEDAAERCAIGIVERLPGKPKWVPPCGVPPGYPFAYEKDIIAKYADDVSVKERLENWLPSDWPEVKRQEGGAEIHRPIRNPIPEREIGLYREDDAHVIVDARFGLVAQDGEGPRLTLPEAGPRRKLRYPRDGRDGELTVGILVSGGIAPGINAVIDGIVRRHDLYRQRLNGPLSIRGYMEGFNSLLHPGGPACRNLDEEVEVVREHAHDGGSILGTGRANELLGQGAQAREMVDSMINRLSGHGVDILYIIGGDGSMRAAHCMWNAARQRGIDLSIVAIPKTMDNDVLWAWQSFGFLSAVEKASEIIRALHTEAVSNPRLALIQLFGSDSGFVVTHAALGSGVCDAVLIPEAEFSLKELSHHVRKRLRSRFHLGPQRTNPHGVILMAETAIPTDYEDYIDDKEVRLYEDEKEAIRAFVNNGRRVHGQTPDALRTGGLKMVARVLERDVQRLRGGRGYWQRFRVFTNEPRHILRAIRPSVADVVFGERLGTLAVDNAMAGYTDFMVSQWLTEYVLVPLELVVLGRKRVPDGIFWKTVLASTGQPERM